MNRSFPRHAVIALLGGLFQTCLQQAGRNDDQGGSGIVAIPTAPFLCLPNA